MKKINWLNYFIEFVIVVLGILLAFQLNTWSGESKQRAILDSHLQNIQEETLYNLSSLEASIVQAEREVSNVDSLLTLVANNNNVDLMNIMTFQLLRIGRVYLQKNAYTTLSSSGDIRFIKDFELKESLVTLYEFYNWAEAMDQISLNHYIDFYYPYVQQNLDLVDGKPQDITIYTSKLFKNILAGYKYQTKARLAKYKECKNIVKGFLEEMNWD